MTEDSDQNRTDDYTSETIQHLEGIEGIRHRPAMYIGGTDLAGLHHLVYEVTDNVLDEFSNGFAATCNVMIHGDSSITISDDGRGIPVDLMKDKGKPALEVVFTEIHAGGKFDRKAYAVGTGGLHGVGITAVNACSEWLEVEVSRDGHVWRMEFAKGRVTSPLTKGGATNQSGTKVTFKADPEIFPNTNFNYDTIHKRLQDCSFLNAGIRINLSDDRTGQSDSFCYEDGLAEFVKWINRTETPLHEDVIRIIGQVDTVEVDIALQWNDGFSESVRCFANGISNSEGGTHLSGFKTALTRTMNNYGKKRNLFKDMNLTGDDFREGLAAVITVRIPQPAVRIPKRRSSSRMPKSKERSIRSSVTCSRSTSKRILRRRNCSARKVSEQPKPVRPQKKPETWHAAKTKWAWADYRRNSAIAGITTSRSRNCILWKEIRPGGLPIPDAIPPRRRSCRYAGRS